LSTHVMNAGQQWRLGDGETKRRPMSANPP
jgi:hypothetical protein